MSHFVLPGLRYAVAKAQNGNFGDSSHAVWPVTWYGPQKITFCPLSPKLWESQMYQKMEQKSPILMQIWVRLTFWPVTQAKEVEIPIFFFLVTVTSLA